MQRIQRSQGRWKTLRSPSENRIRKRNHSKALVHDLDFRCKRCHILIGQIAIQAQSINSAIGFNTPEAAAVGAIPLTPQTYRVSFPEQDTKHHGSIEINDHRARRSSSKRSTAETDRGFIPFSLRKSEGGLSGFRISIPLEVIGRIAQFWLHKTSLQLRIHL